MTAAQLPPSLDGPFRSDLITHAYDILRSQIVLGRLAPGSRLVESDLAERLGVSRTPVRSALQRLQQEGYVTATGGGKQTRMTVAPLTLEDARELFDVVGGVEGVAARRTAELPVAVRGTVVARLEELNGRLLRVAQAPHPDRNALFELDTAFHRHYVEAASGPRILALHDAVKPQAERYVRLYISFLADEIGSSVREHAEIVEQIQRGSGVEAQRAVEANWRNAADRLGRVIVLLGDRGSW